MGIFKKIIMYTMHDFFYLFKKYIIIILKILKYSIILLKKEREWIETLEDEDLAFIKNFVLASGSLKEIAEIYGVTYPTVRLRLDRLIQKIKISSENKEEPYITLIKKMTLDDRIGDEEAKILIQEYRKEKKGEK